MCFIGGEVEVYQTVLRARSLRVASGEVLPTLSRIGTKPLHCCPPFVPLTFFVSAPAFQHTFSYHRALPVHGHGTHSQSHGHSYLPSSHGLTTPVLSSGPSS